MPLVAFVLVECTLGSSAEVAAALSALRGVTMSRTVTGAYDVIARVEVRDAAALGRLISTGVHHVPQVRTTTTVGILP
jgi:DNA-binding Lrp family transcriptional regulator